MMPSRRRMTPRVNHTLENAICRFFTRFGGTVDEAGEAVFRALTGEGFGVRTGIDLPSMLGNMPVYRDPCQKRSACELESAREAIDAEPDIGPLPPCGVVIREDGGSEVRSRWNTCATDCRDMAASGR